MKFNDIIGNDAAKMQLRAMIDNDRIPHAILLSGPQGIGKLALARAAAQYIHCDHRTDGEPCGICPSCRQHQTFNHADTFFSFPVVKGKSNSKPTSDDYINEWKHFLSENPIENYQNWLKELNNENAQPQIYASESSSIITKMSYASYSAKYKVLILWLPEKMNEECANKLLKIIEEPFPDSIFIMVSDNPKEILPTIYSRLQRVEMKKLSTKEVAQFLERHYAISHQDAIAVAAPADGNIITAQSTIALDSENREFFENFMALMRLAYSRDLKSLKKWSENINNFKREKIKRFLQYLARMVRENYIYNLHNSELNYLNRSEEQFSNRFSPFINDGNAERMIVEIEKAERDVQGNANGKILLFDFAIKITILIKR